MTSTPRSAPRGRSARPPLLVLGVLAGALLTGAALLAMVVMLGVPRRLDDVLVLTGVGLVVATTGGVTLNAALARVGGAQVPRLIAWMDLAVVLVAAAEAGLVLGTRTSSGEPASVAAALGLALMAAGLAVPLSRWTLALATRAPGWSSAIAVSIVLGPAAYLVATPPRPPAPIPAPVAPGRLLLIGLDGATLDVVAPLLRDGRLPALGTLMREGASGVMQAHVTAVRPVAGSIARGFLTPTLWETIHTGAPPRRHGIWDFFVTAVPGLEDPIPMRLPGVRPTRRVLSQDARARRLWELVTARGGTAVVVGVPNSWPPSDGDRARILSEDDDPPDATERRTCAPEIRRALGMSETQAIDEPLMQLCRDLWRDRRHARMLHDALRARGAVDVAYLYLEGIDTAQHLFWHTHEPAPGAAGAREHRRLGDVVRRVYEDADRLVALLLGDVDETTTVVVVSDHGGGPRARDESQRPLRHPNVSGSHRANGLLIVRGPGVRPDAALPPTSVYDVMPLLAYVVGLPVAQDLPGHVPIAAFDPTYVAGRPIRVMPTYGDRLRANRSVPRRDYGVRPEK